MSVYVCLLAADVRVLAQRSSAVVAAQAQISKSANLTLSAVTPSAQIERPVEEITDQSARLSSQDEKIVANAPVSRETFCALLSKYLSLS